jgi:hypothetical protein
MQLGSMGMRHAERLLTDTCPLTADRPAGVLYIALDRMPGQPVVVRLARRSIDRNL